MRLAVCYDVSALRALLPVPHTAAHAPPLFPATMRLAVNGHCRLFALHNDMRAAPCPFSPLLPLFLPHHTRHGSLPCISFRHRAPLLPRAFQVEFTLLLPPAFGWCARSGRATPSGGRITRFPPRTNTCGAQDEESSKEPVATADLAHSHNSSGLGVAGGHLCWIGAT